MGHGPGKNEKRGLWENGGGVTFLRSRAFGFGEPFSAQGPGRLLPPGRASHNRYTSSNAASEARRPPVEHPGAPPIYRCCTGAYLALAQFA